MSCVAISAVKYRLYCWAQGGVCEDTYLPCALQLLQWQLLSTAQVDADLAGILPIAYQCTMAGSSWGVALRVTTFGESHAAAVGAVLDGVPPGA